MLRCRLRSFAGLMILGISVLLTLPASAAPLCGAPGDGNGDCRISLVDYADLAACHAGPGSAIAPECLCYDFNADNLIDLRDIQLMQQQFTGDQLLAGCVLPERKDEPGTLRPRKLSSPSSGTWGIPQAPVNDSVYLFSGEFHLTDIDLSIRGRGFDFVWARRYRSKIGQTTTMGNGWDHSYNIWLQQNVGNLILHDGDGRADEYCLTSSGTWAHPEFFREIETIGNGFRMVSHDRASWTFNGFNGQPDDGKLTSLADRNGNTMLFTYDVAGRLTDVHDTLHFNGNPRGIQIAYNIDGFVQTVTDYTGRQVTYDYYQNADIGGEFGDLRSVTSPIVVGTPHANDFPAGKTTVYTYSEGLADPRLNHNLLTITDPKGQTYLSNTYAATLNPLDLEFDRVLVQQVGNPLDQFHFFYLPTTPSAVNNFATSRCIVNDRAGNVCECYHDYRNRLVMLQEFTGRANPTAQTTDVLNRPVNALRPTDPPFYETRHTYNDQSLLTRTLNPEQDFVTYLYEGDINYFAAQRRRCEKVQSIHDPGPRGGDQPTIVEEYEYDPAGNFDTGQVTRAVDGRGNDTLHEYDAAGNRTKTTQRIPSIVDEYTYNSFGQLVQHIQPDNGSGHQRVDEYTYYPLAAGPPYGYLQSVIIDSPGLALTTQYEYDPVGNITRVLDPNGNDTQYIYNALDQVVQMFSREVVPAAGPRYETLRFYDANDNIVQVDVENRDDTGALQANTHFTTIYEYEILDNANRTTEEVAPGQNIVTEFEYDANRNRTLVRSGEATNGNQPNNTTTHLYDERDLVFRVIEGAGGLDESTDQYDYDGNGNRVVVTAGLQGASPRQDSCIYDGYNRRISCFDPMGNETIYNYDANHNVARTEVRGEANDAPGNGGNVRLSETIFVYDPMDRLTNRDVLYFDGSQNPLTDGISSTTYVFSNSSHLLSITDDNSHTSSCVYDSVNRQDVCTDAKGNRAAYDYDANSNVIVVTETEKSDLGLANETFVTTYTYDGLDRRISSTDSSGNTHAYGYDSRDNRVVALDALLNETRHVYDGVNQSTSSILDLDGDGADGNGADISITRIYDDNFRLLQQVDDNGNPTGWQYDDLNRLVSETRADATTEFYDYDVHDNVISTTDANGTVVDSDHDLLNRLISSSVIVAPGVSPDTTFEVYEYDGLSRCVRAEDDDSIVSRAYDSLSHTVSETLNGDTTSSTYDGVGNRQTCVYPSGISLTYTYDDLDRTSTIHSGPDLVSSYLYVGPSRIALQQYGNGARTTFAYDGIQGVPNPPGDFGVKQIVGASHFAGVTPIDQREFTWDSMSNKTERRDTRVGGPGLRHAYTYDDAYRLTVGLEENNIGVATRVSQYTLDGVGNRLSIGGFGGIVGPYFLDPIIPPGDFQVNQYTDTPRDQRLYDDNGNLSVVITPIGNVDLVYDAYDRLVTHVDGLTGDTFEYAYDAFGRRIRSTLLGASNCCECRYRYLGTHVIEDQDTNGTPVATYVHGARGNDIVCVEQGGQIVYHHSDDVGSTTALTDTNGVAIERYEYDDFGAPLFFDGSGNPLGGSAFNNEYLFLGRRWNAESGLYLDGSRYIDPFNGRCITRNPASMWADSGDLGNGYQDAAGNPWSPTRWDPGEYSPSSNVAEQHCPGCGATLCRCVDSPVTRGSGYLSLKKRRSHVTVLKLYGVSGGGGGGGGSYNSSRSNNIMGGLASPPGGGSSGGLRGPGHGKKQTHRGHVTVLKLAGAASGTDYNSSRSNNGSVVAPPGGGGNSCPASKPYKCPDGSCRSSAQYCMDYNVPAGVSHAEAGTGGASRSSDKCKWCGGPMNPICNCMAWCVKHKSHGCCPGPTPEEVKPFHGGWNGGGGGVGSTAIEGLPPGAPVCGFKCVCGFDCYRPIPPSQAYGGAPYLGNGAMGHVDHGKNTLNSHGGGGGSRASTITRYWCTKCKEWHLPMLPATNNTSSR